MTLGETVRFEDVRNYIEEELEGLAVESASVANTFGKPSFTEGSGVPEVLSGYLRTLFGYTMVCFAYIDLLSRLWKGRSRQRGEQTQRMRDFMNEFFQTHPRANAVAIQVWRHGLMHMASPPVVYDQTSNNVYTWIVHWGSETMDPWANITLVPAKDGSMTLLLGLSELVHQLQLASHRFFNRMMEDEQSRTRVVQRWLETRVDRADIESGT